MNLLRPISILLLGLSPAFSQDEPATAQPPTPEAPGGILLPPGVPIPGGPAAPPAGAPNAAAADQNPSTLGDTKITEAIVEPKLSGTALANLYRKYTGRRVIVSAAASSAEFSFVQDASVEDPLTYAEAAELLKKAATIENFVFVPDGADSNLDILTLATGGIRPTNRGVAVFTENDPLPEGDAVISYVMNLKYIKPDEALRTFTQIIGQFGAYGSIAAVPNAASVVITENTSLIRKLIDLKAEIDKPSSQVGTRFINVEYADVTELSTTLNELLTGQNANKTTAGIQRSGTPQTNPAIPGGAEIPQIAGQSGATSSGEDTPVQIIPDPRTNRIFAMGRPVDLLFVEGLVREFDTRSDQRNFLRRKLSFLKVSEFLPIAGDALTRAFSGTGESATGGAGNSPPGSANATTQNTSRTTSQNSQNSSSNSSSGSSTGGSVSLGDPNVNSAPESLLVGRTLLVADNITNSVIVQGPPASVEIVEKLLDQIDVKADQVMISTVFGQLSLTDNTRTGVNWLATSFNGERNGGIAGSVLSPNVSIVQPNSIFDLDTGDSGFPSTNGLSLYGQIGSSLGAYVNLLQSNDNFTILSRPSIFTANNQKGVISSGRRIAIPTNSYQGGTTTGISTNIEYRDVVLKLEVIPLVNSDHEITLQIALLNDEVIGTSEPIGDVEGIPIIGTREILTTVTVPNNQTVVLGGLITTNDSINVTGIPVLSNIPGLGRLFSTKTKDVERSELMIFIQPSIVSSNRTLDHVQADMDSRYDVAARTRGMADGPGVLPPPDSIPVTEKGAARAIIVEPAPEATPTVRRTKLPVHRR
jgi:general secretion pathway protein D